MNEMSVPKGYWLIEDDLTGITFPRDYHLAWKAFEWIANRVSQKLDLPSISIELTTIDAEYFGKYPCLAARKRNGIISDEEVDEILFAISAAYEVSVADMLREMTRPLADECKPAPLTRGRSQGDVLMNETSVPEGYWLIEDEISAFAAFPQNKDLALRIFEWIAERVSRELDLPSRYIDLMVIEAEDFTKHPCLAARKRNGLLSDEDKSEILSAVSSCYEVKLAEMLHEMSPPISNE